MKKHLLALLCGLSLFANASFATGSGRMLCKIKDQRIMDINEGRSEQFTGFANDLEINDTFVINYSYDGAKIELDLSGGVNDFSPFSYDYDANLNERSALLYTNREYNLIRQLSYGVFSTAIGHPQLFLIWRPDQIQMGYIGSSTITLSRYYKSDWMGMYTNHGQITGQPLRSHIVSFDCKHQTQDRLREFFNSAFNRYH